MGKLLAPDEVFELCLALSSLPLPDSDVTLSDMEDTGRVLEVGGSENTNAEDPTS